MYCTVLISLIPLIFNLIYFVLSDDLYDVLYECVIRVPGVPRRGRVRPAGPYDGAPGPAPHEAARPGEAEQALLHLCGPSAVLPAGDADRRDRSAEGRAIEAREVQGPAGEQGVAAVAEGLRRRALHRLHKEVPRLGPGAASVAPRGAQTRVDAAAARLTRGHWGHWDGRACKDTRQQVDARGPGGSGHTGPGEEGEDHVRGTRTRPVKVIHTGIHIVPFTFPFPLSTSFCLLRSGTRINFSI